MGEDATRADQSASTLPPSNNSDSLASGDVDAQDLFVPSSSPTSPVQTLTRRSSKSPTSPTGTGNPVSAITVVALLDQLVVMIETVQENQRRMEKRQADLEHTVRAVQGDLTRLTKSHGTTLGGVNKLLERTRKTSLYVKEVRERLERQSGQVKRLEANHSHLLKRNHFKVLIYQEDNEIPTTLFTKDSTADLALTSHADDSTVSQRASVIDPDHSHEEALQTISLSSDEDEGAASPPHEGGTDQAEALDDEFPIGSEHLEYSRADKFKRSSLKKVDSLKKAFSRSSIEKKINKIVPPEKREKLMKSFSPNHPKSPTSKNSSFRVVPLTFNVKKVRDGNGIDDGEASQSGDPTATVDVPAMGGPDGQLPVAEVHNEEPTNNGKDHTPSTADSADGDAPVTENGQDGPEDESENGSSDKPAKEEESPESKEADKENHENGEDHAGEEEEEKSSPALEALPPAPVAVEQAS